MTGRKAAKLPRGVAVIILFVATGLVLVLSPGLAVLAAAASPLCGRRRPIRILVLAIHYLVHDCLTVLACAGLWLYHGCGRRLHTDAARRHHYRLAWWFLDRLYRRATAVLEVDVAYDDSGDGEAVLGDVTRPVVVLARHGGVADSFLIVRELLRLGRQPRIVMDERLSLDPVIGVLGRRLPVVFVPAHGRHRVVAEISRLAAGMADGDALLIFPEGGNFTRRRRQRRIASVHRRDSRRGRRVERLRNVLPVRPAGTLAALEGAPAGQVVILGHQGMGRIERPVEIFRDLPVEARISLRVWAYESEDLPPGGDQLVSWLDERWAEVDRWIDSARSRSSSAA
ncbi:MAG TPA: 1-acyl-sn-glycerol-3-phosphate acyltransferase [Acidimicrobiales bacterium]|nr:1-acyl-sn-glycerol-3-phosphate acyltransferase [Acidimicrobiales bacterium]